MRYSRLLEENSYSNRKADYAWLLFLSAVFLLVHDSPHLHQSGSLISCTVNLASTHYAISRVLTRFRARIHLVPQKSKYQNVPVRRCHVCPPCAPDLCCCLTTDAESRLLICRYVWWPFHGSCREALKLLLAISCVLLTRLKVAG